MTCCQCGDQKATQKCLICEDVFCDLCGAVHYNFYGYHNIEMIKLEDSSDAQTNR